MSAVLLVLGALSTLAVSCGFAVLRVLGVLHELPVVGVFGALGV